MHTAPPVSYPTGRSRMGAALAAAAWCAGLAAMAAWTLQVAAPGWRQVAGFGVLLACGAVAAFGWRSGSPGRLSWDGSGWSWHAGSQPETGEPRMVLDLQASLLLRWSPHGGPTRWLWLARERAPADWSALRRAVYSRARTEAPDGALPPTAQR